MTAIFIREEAGWCLLPECGCRTVAVRPLCAVHYAQLTTKRRAALEEAQQDLRAETPGSTLRWLKAALAAVDDIRGGVRPC